MQRSVPDAMKINVFRDLVGGSKKSCTTCMLTMKMNNPTLTVSCAMLAPFPPDINVGCGSGCPTREPKVVQLSFHSEGGWIKKTFGQQPTNHKAPQHCCWGEGGSIDGTNSAMQKLQAMDCGGATFLPSTVPTEDSSMFRPH